jgi:predicted N-acetyltransferase YhbS
VEIRAVRPDEYEILGELTEVAYASIDGYEAEPDYVLQLRDIAGRAEAPATAVLVAVVGDRVLGGVTYVADPSSPMAEHEEPNVAGIRMLAVDPGAQGRGIGEALTRACLDRARAEGRAAIVLHSTAWMHTAHRLYGRLGFERDPTLDWEPAPGLTLLGYRLDLDGDAPRP